MAKRRRKEEDGEDHLRKKLKRKEIEAESNGEKLPISSHTEAVVSETCEPKGKEGTVLANINLAWTEEEMRTLIKNIEAQLPTADSVSYKNRLAKINWEEVKFDPYNAEDCLNKCQDILNKQRTFRLLYEILQDAKEWIKRPWSNFHKSKVKKHPEKPSKPLTSYMIFFLEKKKKLQRKFPNMSMPELSKLIGEKYKLLPEDKKEKYKLKAVQLKEEYEAKLETFYDNYPDERVEKKKTEKKQKPQNIPEGLSRPLPPFKLFCETKINKHKDDPDFDSKKTILRCKELWKKMSNKKKVVWIRWTHDRELEYMNELKKYCNENPNFDISKVKQSVLTKEERNLLDRMSGKPEKPPNSVYSLFSRTFMRNDAYHNKKVNMKELGERWKAMPESEKQEYAEKLKQMQEEYKVEYAAYLESLPEERRLEELESSKPKKKKSQTIEPKNQPPISKWLEKKTGDLKENKKSNLYKNEPPKPPGSPFEYFLEQFKKSHPDYSGDYLVTKARLHWDALSRERKRVYKKELKEKKLKYIKEYEAFLKNLNEKELKEYSVIKDQLKRSTDDSSFEEEEEEDEVDENQGIVGRKTVSVSKKDSSSSDDDTDSSSD
ncbi:nucleolar transcription factor 1-like [Lycorma delicatula]|uniref:nucleolar transcription factor 1-like n=1 Tax=Lycorma delicatula TaxID=130591 RepID=UPI003F516967